MHANVSPLLHLLRTSRAPAGHWNELLDAEGSPRAIWQRFFALLGGEGAARLNQAVASVTQRVRANDISYNTHDENGAACAWALDALPFLVDGQEWATIAHGVAQRARLLNAIVADIYGPQALLQRGLLPGALVFSHPGYLRAMRGFTPHAGQFVQMMAVDLTRAPDGGWTVLAHYTSTPSGLGYALENRQIVANLFSDTFREMRVSNLMPSYSHLAALLTEAARPMLHDDSSHGVPHIALLSPGPHSPTYFGQAYLARHLGLTLVEGKDLTVRSDRLYLKTLAGLDRVHGLLRCTDDALCDPLELCADSTLGVPGLLQVMRADNVMVANAPGAGFAESPALHGFLPALAWALLGEPLALPTVATWWCGEAAAREEAFTRFDHALLLPAWPGALDEACGNVNGNDGHDGSNGAGMERGVQRLADWRERIERVPDGFTIQEALACSCAPRYENGILDARAAVLRVYAFAGQHGDWHVMPGGFTRLGNGQQATVSMQSGSSSVDTWVLSNQSAPAFLMQLSPMKAADLTKRRQRPVSSRAAENLFWAGRYSERVENNVRLCRTIFGALEHDNTPDMRRALVRLASLSGLGCAEGDVVAQCELYPRTFERVLVSRLSGAGGVGLRNDSIGQNLAGQMAACSEIRARLSSDHWRNVLAARNDFHDALKRYAPDADHNRNNDNHNQGHGDRDDYDRVALIGALEKLSTQLTAISGAQGDRMMRDVAWRLLFVGRHIERVSTMAMYLRVVDEHGLLAQPVAFDLLLQLFDSTLTYRSLYPGRFEVPALLDLLVIEQTNPRGLYGVYQRLRTKLDEIPRAASHAHRMLFAEQMPPVSDLPDLELLCEQDGAGRHPVLDGVCEQLRAQVAAASSEISVRYFSHAVASSDAGMKSWEKAGGDRGESLDA